MKTKMTALAFPALLIAAPAWANEHPFAGPSAGIEVSYEDYGSGVDGETVAAVAGWDFRVGDAAVLGLDARYTVHGVEGSETTATPGQLLQTVDVAVKDNWGIGGRAGLAVRNDLLLYVKGGYENLRINAVRTVRSQVCAPPNGCQISRTDFSFDDDMWTVGLGADWAVTANLRLRGQYSYGDSSSYDRNRFSMAVAFQF